jgi:hypothetical protein
MPHTAIGIHQVVLSIDRSHVLGAVRSILDQGGWCVLEVCVDVPRQRWEARAVIFDLAAEAAADAAEQEIACDPELDARLTGYDRRMLQPDPGMGAHLVYLADAPAPPRPPSHPVRSDTQCPEGKAPRKCDMK